MSRNEHDPMTLDQDITIGCAFRYALGRSTYVVSSVASEIEENVERISIKTRHRMIAEIEEAITNKTAGMQMDVERWWQCRGIIEQSLKEVMR